MQVRGLAGGAFSIPQKDCDSEVKLDVSQYVVNFQSDLNEITAKSQWKNNRLVKTNEITIVNPIFSSNEYASTLLQLDLALKDEKGGDISSFITNGEWDLIGKNSLTHTQTN